MGYRSSFSSMIECLKSCGGAVNVDRDGVFANSAQLSISNEDTMIDQLDQRRSMSRRGATARERRIMRAWRNLSARHQLVLSAYYEPRQLPPDVRRVLGDLAPVAGLTATARGIPGYSMAWLTKACSPKSPDARATKIKSEASRLYQGALHAYEAAARGGTVAALRAALDAAVAL